MGSRGPNRAQHGRVYYPRIEPSLGAIISAKTSLWKNSVRYGSCSLCRNDLISPMRIFSLPEVFIIFGLDNFNI